MNRGFIAPLRQRNFRLLFAGQAVSNLGDWLDFLALSVLIVYVWHQGAASLAALAVVIAVPWIVVAPFSGVFADRWPKRRVMIGSDLSRAAIVVGLVFAPNLVLLLTLVGLKTAFSTLFSPAEQATIRLTVPEQELHAANALSQFVMQATKVIGPALGGLLVSLWSPRVAFAIDAATFLCSAAILSRLGPVGAAREDVATAEEEGGPAAGGFWPELRAGLAYIAGRRALMVSMFSFGAAIFLVLAYDSLSALAFRELGVSRGLFGTAVAGIGLGGVLGALAVGRFGDGVNPFVLMGGGSAIVGSLIALMGAALLTGFAVPPILWTPVLLAIGVGAAAFLIAGPTIVQRETPPALMGRVSTSSAALPTVCQLVAPIVGAAVARWQSVGFVFSTAGGGLALLGLVVLIVHPAVGIGVPGGDAEELRSAASDVAAVSIIEPKGVT